MELLEVFVCPELCRGEEAQRLLKDLSGGGVRRLDVPSEAVFARLTHTGSGPKASVGVAAVIPRRLEELALPSNPLVVVLEGVEKPGNVGAVLRSARAKKLGLSALVVADLRTDLFNPNYDSRPAWARSFLFPSPRPAPGDVLAWLARDLQRYDPRARVQGAVSYTEVDYRLPTAIILGSEAAGLGEMYGAAACDVHSPLVCPCWAWPTV